MPEEAHFADDFEMQSSSTVVADASPVIALPCIKVRFWANHASIKVIVVVAVVL